MEHRKKYAKRQRPKMEPRVMLDYFMGALWISAGLFIIFSKYLLGYDYFEDSDFVKGWVKWFVGFIFMLYGAFRIYRGYQVYKERNEYEEE